ncbi:MAG: YerC/YecD family TrpR-related protein [Candidatus Peribacteraceae bacterium]|nr:YerC/YecD family TrpR-related protein [Candidatus Peribacteraceae bacterium]
MPTKKRFTDDSYRKEPWFRALCSAFLSCKNEEEMGSLLRDIGTLSELQSWGERLEVAKLLVQGWSYREVARRTGASTTTVTRVARFIENGEGGYRKILHAHRHHRTQTTVKTRDNTNNINTSSALTENKKSEQISILHKYLHRKQSPSSHE